MDLYFSRFSQIAFKMGRKCSVYNCRSGYDGHTVAIYKFPEDALERQQWVSCIPNKFIRITQYMGVCALHWPPNTPFKHNKKGGRYPTPTVPPSIFPDVPAFCVPSGSGSYCIPRSTAEYVSSARNPAYDGMSALRDNGDDRLQENTYVDDFKPGLGMASWSREDVQNFLAIYKSHECLWKTKSKDYGNKLSKENAYEDLVQFVRQFDKTANRDMITKKINSLRTTFRKELRRVKRSKTKISEGGGGGEEGVYVPTLWYFVDMLFLVDQYPDLASGTSTSNYLGIDGMSNSVPNSPPLAKHVKVETMDTLPDDYDYGEMQRVRDMEESNEMVTFAADVDSSRPISPTGSRASSHSSASGSWTKSRAKANATKRKADRDLLTLVIDRLKMPEEDEHGAFAKTIAFKLRKLNSEQCLYAGKLINDVLYEAGLGELSRVSRLVADPTRNPVTQ